MQRTTARTTAPQGQDRQRVKCIAGILREIHPRAAAIRLLVRATGMRLREAVLADLIWLNRETNQLGRINIQEGNKKRPQGCYGVPLDRSR